MNLAYHLFYFLMSILFLSLIVDPAYPLTPEEQEALAIIDSQYQERIDSIELDTFKMAAEKCGISRKNYSLLKAEIFLSKDSVSLDCIESKVLQVQEVVALNLSLSRHREKVEFGRKIVLEYTFASSQKDLTDEQRLELAELLSPISLLLSSGSLDAAKAALLALQTSELLSQSEKDSFISKIEAYQVSPQ